MRAHYGALLVNFACWIRPVESFSSPTSPSPWAPATWTITLDFGREKGTSMPEEYGAGGSRIVAPVTVEIQSSSAPESDTFVGQGASSIVPETIGSYISMQGEQQLELSTGGWNLEFPPGKKGLASILRFWMTLETKLERNDVRLPQGERLYFCAKAWREDEYERGLQRMRPIHARARQAQKVLEERLSHETGDRRLDGNDALETLQAYGDMTQIVLDRDAKRNELLRALEKYPPVDQDLPEGPWPGAEEWLSLSNSKNPILILAKSKKMLMGDDFHVVGTWTATPVLSEDEYELVSEEDKNEGERIIE